MIKAEDVWRRRALVLLCIVILSWALIAVLAYGYSRNAARVIFRNYTGVGLPEYDVLRRVGAPEAVLTDAAQFDHVPFNGYHRSQRPMTPKVLVYFRFGHMIAVYLDDDDYVVCSFWGRPRK